MNECMPLTSDSRIPQDNSLWRLFRILVEEEIVPDEISLHVKQSVGIE